MIIATYGEDSWRQLALDRAFPSAKDQGAHEIIVGHDAELTIGPVRNVLAAKASGDWLAFLDADDQFAPGYLDAMTRAFERERDSSPDGLLLTPAVLQVKNGKRRGPLFFDRGLPLTRDNWLVLGTLVPTDLFHEVGGFSDYPHGYEDWSLWAKCWKAGAKIVKVRDAHYVYYWNQDSEHHRLWRDRRSQREMHRKVAAELFGNVA